MGKPSGMAQYLACGVAATVILAYFLEYLISSRDDAREPPRLRAKIPLVGHLLGIITSGPSYHSTLKYTTAPPKPCVTTIASLLPPSLTVDRMFKEKQRCGNFHHRHLQL